MTELIMAVRAVPVFAEKEICWERDPSRACALHGLVILMLLGSIKYPDKHQLCYISPLQVGEVRAGG